MGALVIIHHINSLHQIFSNSSPHRNHLACFYYCVNDPLETNLMLFSIGSLHNRTTIRFLLIYDICTFPVLVLSRYQTYKTSRRLHYARLSLHHHHIFQFYPRAINDCRLQNILWSERKSFRSQSKYL